MSTTTINSALPADWRDFLALTKPRVMTLVVFTGLCGLLAAPVPIHPVLGFTAVLCIALGAGAAAAPAPRAMQRIAAKPSTGGSCTGATSSPQRPVKTTSVITRGLVSARKSRHSAGMAAGRLCVTLFMSLGAYRRKARRREEPVRRSRQGPVLTEVTESAIDGYIT